MKYRLLLIVGLLGTILVNAMEEVQNKIDLSAWGPIGNCFDKKSVNNALKQAIKEKRLTTFDLTEVYVVIENNEGKMEYAYLDTLKDIVNTTEMFDSQTRKVTDPNLFLLSEISQGNYVYEKEGKILLIGTNDGKLLQKDKLTQVRDKEVQKLKKIQKSCGLTCSDSEEEEEKLEPLSLESEDADEMMQNLDSLKKDEENEIAPIENKDASQTLGRNWKVRHPQ